MAHGTDWIDELARRSPTALAMALERAIATHNSDIERVVLEALGRLGIVVVDRATLAGCISASLSSRATSRSRGE